MIGRADLDTLLSDRDQINAELTAVIDAPTEGPWGLNIERFEINDIVLPECMKRSMFLRTMFEVATKKNTLATADAVSGPALRSGVIPSPRSASR